MGFGTTYDTRFSDLVRGSSLWSHKENWLVFIYSLTLEICQIVLITTKVVKIGLGPESVITTQTTCW